MCRKDGQCEKKKGWTWIFLYYGTFKGQEKNEMHSCFDILKLLNGRVASQNTGSMTSSLRDVWKSFSLGGTFRSARWARHCISEFELEPSNPGSPRRAVQPPLPAAKRTAPGDKIACESALCEHKGAPSDCYRWTAPSPLSSICRQTERQREVGRQKVCERW